MKTMTRSECAVLSLVLKGEWYDMIERGEKKEEYRDAKDYWLKRFHNWHLNVNAASAPVVEFRRGHVKNAPRMAFWCLGLSTAAGMMSYAYTDEQRHPEWGEPTWPHFVIRLGGRVELVDDMGGRRSGRGQNP